MRRVGEVLVEKGLISPRDWEAALAAQRQLAQPLGATLVRMGAVSEADWLAVMAEVGRVPILDSVSAPGFDAVEAALQRTRVSVSWLEEKGCVLWFSGEGEAERLSVAARDPFEPAIQEAAEQWHPEPAQFFVAPQNLLDDVLGQLGDLPEAADSDGEGFGADAQRLREMAEEAPVIDFVNAVFAEAVARRASDVHIEPFEDRFVVRLRVDGILSQWRTAPRAQFDAVASRIKLLSGMDIAERRLPQDGRQSIRISGKEVDLRVSTLPAKWGESIVMRLLGKTRSLPELAELGVAADHRAALLELTAKPNGVILITGPTGSGKTTTIYRLISHLNDGVRKIVTVEDPVEFDLPGVTQVHVRADIGLTFAAGLRSILRQDPDVIMVGEIRDRETAQIAVQAALTGHLVISTVHTNSALAAVPRLLDLGVEEYLLADVLRGLVAQRLLRRLCPQCAQPGPPPSREDIESLSKLGHNLGGDPDWRVPSGCRNCGGSGYLGRLGVYEVAEIDADMARSIRERRAEADLLQTARLRGFRSMYEDGLLKARAGETSLAEVLRVLGASKDAA